MNNFRLWIDAVGGYLVCPGSQVRLGQWLPSPANSATDEKAADIALLADLANHHATLCRHEEGYTVAAQRQVWIDDRPVAGKALLRDGAKLRLGECVRLKFQQPTALSGSAVLTIASKHRTQPATNGIILLAETCLLGPTAACHVHCPRWTSQVVLQRHGDDLYCIVPGEFRVAGQHYHGRAKVRWGELVEGRDFSFSTEAI